MRVQFVNAGAASLEAFIHTIVSTLLLIELSNPCVQV